MGGGPKVRIVRLVDFTAESLEAEASRMPPSYKETADIWLEMAQTLRRSDNPKTIRVIED